MSGGVLFEPGPVTIRSVQNSDVDNGAEFEAARERTSDRDRYPE